MAVAEFAATPASYTKTAHHHHYSSQLSYVSTRLSHHRRISLRPYPRAQNFKICCSVTSKEILAPVASLTEELRKKPECYGVFCLTYDLKAEEETKSWKKLINIAVSGAAGMISNHLLFKIASGEVFGPDQPVALKLLGSERSFGALEDGGR